MEKIAREQAEPRTDTLVWGKNAVTELLKSGGAVDTVYLADSLPQLDLFVVTEQMMTPAAQYADIVLPCVSYYEEELDLVAGGEHWYLQLRQRAISPVGESRNDYEIFKEQSAFAVILF